MPSRKREKNAARTTTSISGKPSSRRKPGGGFTLEVQHLSSKDLCRGPEVKAFARGVVVGGDG
ncbi:MAG: hypothetical protein ACI9P3_006321, partial [Bradyrhizobium sp.]